MQRNEDRDLAERINNIRVKEFEEGYARGAEQTRKVLDRQYGTRIAQLRGSGANMQSGLLTRLDFLEHLLYKRGSAEQQRDYLHVRQRVHEMPEELLEPYVTDYIPENNWATYIAFMRKHPCHFQRFRSSDPRASEWRLFSTALQHVEGSCLEEVLDKAIEYARLRESL